jgi:hypothetical protein
MRASHASFKRVGADSTVGIAFDYEAKSFWTLVSAYDLEEFERALANR